MILFFFNHEKTFFTLILFKLTLAHLPLGIILDKLSLIPPPVILAQPLIKLLLIKFGFTYCKSIFLNPI